MRDPDYVTTPHLRKEILLAIDKTRFLFDLSDENYEDAMQFRVRRTLNGVRKAYRNHIGVPACSLRDKFIYFPEKHSPFSKYNALDDPGIIYHETGHHLHGRVNAKIIEEKKVLEREGDSIYNDPRFIAHHNLCEFVAEYPVMILGFGKYCESFFSNYWRRELEIFSELGPEFLLELSRMDTNEALERGLVNSDKKSIFG